LSPPPRRMAMPGITPILIQDLPTFILPERPPQEGKSGAIADAHGGCSNNSTTPVTAASVPIRSVALQPGSEISVPLGRPAPAELTDVEPEDRTEPGGGRAGRFAGGSDRPPLPVPEEPQPASMVRSRSEPQVRGEYEETDTPLTSSAVPLPYMEADRQRTSSSWLRPRWRSARRMRPLEDRSPLPRAQSPSSSPSPSPAPSSIHLPHIHLHLPGRSTATRAGAAGDSQPHNSRATVAVLHEYGDRWGGHGSFACDSGATTAAAQVQ
ncbi:hypothetical protein Vretimale_8498, partial [Volvox reticuliferus]